MRIATILFLCVLAAASLYGCDRESPRSSPPTAKGVVGVSVITLENPFFARLTSEIATKARERGFEVAMSTAEFSQDGQDEQVRAYIEQGAVAIVLCPVDSDAVGGVVREANEAGIPVFTADIAVTAKDAEIVCHIATDNFRGGELAAEAMAAELPAGGAVAIIDHPQVESANQRTRGFEKRLAELNAERGAPIEIVAKLPGQGTAEKGYEAASELLASRPGISGIFAINDPSALGVVRALGEVDRLNDGVVVIGFDGAEAAVEALVAGHIDADVVQHPEMIGWRVVDAISDHLLGRGVEPVQRLRPTVIRASDAIAPADTEG